MMAKINKIKPTEEDDPDIKILIPILHYKRYSVKKYTRQMMDWPCYTKDEINQFFAEKDQQQRVIEALDQNIWPLDIGVYGHMEIKYIGEVREKQRRWISNNQKIGEKKSIGFLKYRAGLYVESDVVGGRSEIASIKAILMAEEKHGWKGDVSKRPDLRHEDAMIREILVTKPNFVPCIKTYVKWLETIWNRNLKVYYIKDDTEPNKLGRTGSDTNKQGDPKYFIQRTDGGEFVLGWIRNWTGFKEHLLE